MTAGSPVRAFIVGAPRSGTTLLQAMLAAHPAVVSPPETFYFRHVFGRLWSLRALGIVSPRSAASALARTATDLGRDATPPRSLRIGPWATAFVRLLDGATSAAGAGGWIEKSPRHLECTDLIERHVPGARILHVVRDGRAVTASMVVAAEQDPTRWMGQLAGRDWRRRHVDAARLRAAAISGAVARWNHDVARTGTLLPRPAHHLVRYEQLIAEPEEVLRPVLRVLDLPWDPAVLDHEAAAPDVVGRRHDRRHMEGVQGALRRSPIEGRFAEVLTADEQQLARRTLVEGGDAAAALAVAGGAR